MTAIGQTTDRWGRAVELTDKVWGHVVRQHPELTPERAIVFATVAYPDIVMRDADHADRENFYRVVEWTPVGTPRRYLKVCVEYGLSGGTIITAFRSRNIKPGESPKWP